MSGIVGSAGSKSGVISDGQNIYAQLTSSSTTYGDMTFSTQTGDTTNITRSGVNVTLVKGGVYLITCGWIWYGENIRYVWGNCVSVSGTYGTSGIFDAVDSIGQQSDTPDYGGATGTFTGAFAAGDVFKFSFYSDPTTALSRSESHASIIRIIE